MRGPGAVACRIRATRRWLDRVVIGQRLCPFAPPVREPPALNLIGSCATELDAVVEELASAASALRRGLDDPTLAPPAGETTLLILDHTIGDSLLGWHDLISLSWRLQEEAIVDRGHGTHLQLVLFHSHATHTTYVEAGAPSDAGDYTIRSPYPTVQLLREVDILRAVRSYPGAADIPARNRLRMRAAGLEACAERLRRCSQPDEPDLNVPASGVRGEVSTKALLCAERKF